MINLFVIAISAIFIENFVLVKFLGICPFLGVTKKMSSAIGMGIAVIFVMTVASAVTWCAEKLLVALNVSYLRTMVFILIIAVIVQIIEMVLHRYFESLFNMLGIYLPLITTNCAVLGVALLNVNNGYNFIESVVFGCTAGIGFLMAMLIFAGIREKLDFAETPKSMEGLPIALISAGLLALAFMGFQGFKLPV